MNLIDAVKSGRPFRRHSWGDVAWWRTDVSMTLGPGDILADDWVIQEPSVAITRTQFWEAWEEMLAHERGQRYGDNQLHIATRYPKYLGCVLAKRLGLEGT